MRFFPHSPLTPGSPLQNSDNIRRVSPIPEKTQRTKKLQRLPGYAESTSSLGTRTAASPDSVASSSNLDEAQKILNELDFTLRRPSGSRPFVKPEPYEVSLSDPIPRSSDRSNTTEDVKLYRLSGESEFAFESRLAAHHEKVQRENERAKIAEMVRRQKEERSANANAQQQQQSPTKKPAITPTGQKRKLPYISPTLPPKPPPANQFDFDPFDAYTKLMKVG